MRPRMFLMAIAICLLLAASAQAGPLFGTTKTVDIAFVNYCDGMHLVINYQTGVVLGNRAGSCIENSPVWGTVGTVLNGTYRGGAVILTDVFDSLHVVITDNPKKWVYYYPDGTIMNSGIYVVGVPANAGASGSSVQK